MSSETVFSKIIKREIPADIVFEDEHCICINDIQPQAPIHLLIVPKKHIDMIANAQIEDASLLGHLMLVAGRVAKQLGVEDGFRLIINNGEKGGQTVFHLHIHLLAGTPFSEGLLAQ